MTDLAAGTGDLLPCVSAQADGARLRVRVSPGAAADRLLGLHDDAVKVAVTAAPERGKANKALCTFLARQLSLKKAAIRVCSGQTSQNKVLAIDGIDAKALSARLREALVQ